MRLARFLTATTIITGLAAFAASPSHAGSFVNGGFEDGTFNGWTQGSGYWNANGGAPCGGNGNNCTTYYTGPGGTLTPSLYLPGGAYNNPAAGVFTITNPGTDSVTGGNLSTVYSGTHSAKLNDINNNYSVSAISQTVASYTDSHIFFAWAAVLEGSHGITDSDNFTLLLTDDTKGTVLYEASYSSAQAQGSNLFHQFGNAFYTDWQIADIDLSALGGIGDQVTLSLLGADCPYGGHWGYVYLDGFGSAPPPPNVPEPASMLLLGSGMLGLAAARRKFRKA